MCICYIHISLKHWIICFPSPNSKHIITSSPISVGLSHTSLQWLNYKLGHGYLLLLCEMPVWSILLPAKCFLSGRWHSLLWVPLHSESGPFWTAGWRNFGLFGQTACAGSPCSAARWERDRQTDISMPAAAAKGLPCFLSFVLADMASPGGPRLVLNCTTTAGMGLQFRQSIALSGQEPYSPEQWFST